MDLPKRVLLAMRGKKTYIVALVLAALNLAVAMNWISPAHLTQINFALTALGLGALRAGVGTELGASK